MPIDTPNPYGSYFAFGGIPGMASSPMGFDSHLGRALGAGGGNNPTEAEDMVRRGMDRLQQSAMSNALRSDARAANMVNFVRDQMFGGDTAKMDAARQRTGISSGDMREWVAALINQPGASGFMGGDIRSIRLGASAVAGGGGMVHVAGGSTSGMFGSGMVQNAAAQQIFESVNRRFWNTSGAANLGNTNGMNRDQIGGIMMMGAQQGAFSGLDMGKISRTGDKLKFDLNPEAISKIETFTKEAAKSLSGLIDVFGDRSIGELSSIAQKITGLDMSRLKNVEMMGQRISALKGTATTLGMDARALMETAAGANQMGAQAGIVNYSGGAEAAMQGAHVSRQLQAQPGFFRSAPSAQEVTSQIVRNQAALMSDPLGARIMAGQLALETGMVKGGAADQLRAQMGGLSRENVGAFDTLFRQSTGMNASNMIQTMGGGAGIHGTLSPESQAAALGFMGENMRGRNLSRIRDMSSNMLGAAGGRAAANLVDVFKAGDLQKMAEAFDAGKTEDAVKIAMDSGAVKDRAQALGLVGQLGAFGGHAAASLQVVEKGVRRDISKTFLSRQEEMSQKRMQAEVTQLSSDDSRKLRGMMARGVQGFLEMAGQDSPMHRIAMTAAMDRHAVHGMGIGDEVFLKEGAHGAVGDSLTPTGVKSFTKTLQNLARQDPEMANRMGFSMKDLRDDPESFAKNNYGRIRGMMKDPLEMQRITAGREVVMLPGGQLAWTKKSDIPSQEIGQAAASAAVFSEAFKDKDEDDQGRRFFSTATSMLQKKQLQSPGQLDLFYSQISSRADDLTEKQLADIAKVDDRGARTLLDKFTQDLTGVQAESDAYAADHGGQTRSDLNAKAAALQRKRDALQGAGATPSDAASKQFIGVLQLQDGNGVSIRVTEKK